MSPTFRITAKGLIYLHDRVLLIRKPEGIWDLPGGRLDAGEHPQQALRREIKEELGIAADIGSIADCSLRRRPGQIDVFVVSYHCRTKASLADIRLSDEHTRARLFPVAAVDGLAMNDTYKAAIVRGFPDSRRGTQTGLHPSALEAFAFLLKSRAFEAI